jgi:3-oxoacyl-[acyl-carrier protein] reductase
MQDKYALVTGGSRGIGRAICVKLAEAGYNILINYKGNTEAAQQTAALVQAAGTTAEILCFDVANREEVRKVLGGWMEAHKENKIEVLVNNAGIRNDGLMAMMADEQWDTVVETSLGGWYNVTKQVLTPMALNRYGRIINIVSLSGLKGMPGQTNYSAAKAGIIGATKALAQEMARRNITVNAIAPGFIKTDMVADLEEKEYINMIPAKRFGEAEEVADLAAFLASKKSGYITGQVISINGGLYP